MPLARQTIRFVQQVSLPLVVGLCLPPCSQQHLRDLAAVARWMHNNDGTSGMHSNASGEPRCLATPSHRDETPYTNLTTANESSDNTVTTVYQQLRAVSSAHRTSVVGRLGRWTELKETTRFAVASPRRVADCKPN